MERDIMKACQTYFPAKNRKNFPSGFTLIEICVVLVILGIIIVGAANFFTRMYDLWLDNSSQTDIEQNARIAMDEMTKYIRQASSPAVTNSVVIDRYDAGEPNTSLIRFHLLDSSTIQYYQHNNRLYRNWQRPGGSAVEAKMTDNLTDLHFIKENAQGIADDYSIHIATLTLQKGSQTVTLRGYVHIKNP
jgi:prepilin-type N-terminal cleavage/methylation domain-containing protein